MLLKAERLKEKNLFNLAFKKRQRLNTNLLTLYYVNWKKDINNLPKTAFIVSLKIDKRATKRNLIKRRMKAAYQLIKSKIITTYKNNDSRIHILIWVAKSDIKNATFEQIKQSMDVLISKLIHNGRKT